MGSYTARTRSMRLQYRNAPRRVLGFTAHYWSEGTLAETPPCHDADEILCRPQQWAMGKAKRMPRSEDTKMLGKVVCLVHSGQVRSKLGPIMCQNGTYTEQHT